MVSRFITKQIINSLKPSRIVGVFGPRRSGKTTLMNIIRDKIGQDNVLMVQGENVITLTAKAVSFSLQRGALPHRLSTKAQSKPFGKYLGLHLHLYQEIAHNKDNYEL